MDDRFHLRSAIAANDRLDAWDDEGGAPAGAARADAASGIAAPETERRLLERLGAALRDEWHRLPMPLRRSIYDRAVGSETTCGPSSLKRSVARYLHDHKGHT